MAISKAVPAEHTGWIPAKDSRRLIRNMLREGMSYADIAALSAVTKSHNALTVVDNTFASPYLVQPLALGADIASYSTTKYHGGHSDVIGGALVTNNPELAKKLRYIENAVGSVPAPWDLFLIMRGIKTLSLRMQAHCRNAQAIAEYLETHPAIEHVYYPGLKSHPQHDLAGRQMRMYGGMVSFTVKGGVAAAHRLVESTKLFTYAVSLGGVESLPGARIAGHYGLVKGFKALVESA
jgi:cystathionine beta-lyase/cystathionine gamma-synthase